MTPDGSFFNLIETMLIPSTRTESYMGPSIALLLHWHSAEIFTAFTFRVSWRKLLAVPR
jgi:hypothetical protein